MSDTMPANEASVSTPVSSSKSVVVASARLAKEPLVAQEAVENETLYAEDLDVGQQWHSPWRNITGDNVETFSELTGDFDPLHAGDDDERMRSPFGRPVAHGLLGLSVLAGLSTEYPRAATLALVSISDWNFDNPVFFGERVRVITTVSATEPHGRRAAKVTWHRRLVSDDGRTLQQGQFVTLVASKNRYPRQPR